MIGNNCFKMVNCWIVFVVYRVHIMSFVSFIKSLKSNIWSAFFLKVYLTEFCVIGRHINSFNPPRIGCLLQNLLRGYYINYWGSLCEILKYNWLSCNSWSLDWLFIEKPPNVPNLFIHNNHVVNTALLCPCTTSGVHYKTACPIKSGHRL